MHEVVDAIGLRQWFSSIIILEKFWQRYGHWKARLK